MGSFIINPATGTIQRVVQIYQDGKIQTARMWQVTSAEHCEGLGVDELCYVCSVNGYDSPTKIVLDIPFDFGQTENAARQALCEACYGQLATDTQEIISEQ